LTLDVECDKNYKLIIFKKMSKRLILLVIGGIIYPFVAQATIDLSVTSFQGGQSLNFGRVDSSSVVTIELKIQITSTDTTPYQVKQILLEPIVSEKGTPLKDEVVFFYTIRGSNSRGSLYNTILKPLSFREDTLYVSDNTGNPDSFKVAYIFNGKKLTTQGYFFGRIGYVLEPKQGSPKTVIFNIEFDARLKLEAKIYLPGNTLKLSTRTKDTLSSYLKVSLKSRVGKDLNVYQILEAFPENYKGMKLPEGILKFYISESLKGKGEVLTPTILGRKELLIYRSREGSDEFKVNFLLDEGEVKNLEAGIYRGRLIYRINQDGEEKLIPVDLEIEIEKKFDINVMTQGLSFYGLRPDFPPQEREVIIRIDSNLRRPYQVSQRITGPLTDEKGNTIPFKYLLMRGELLEGKGEILYPSFEATGGKEDVIFLSDANGEPASFRIIYKLVPSLEILAGNYSTTVTYSLSER